MLGLVVSIFCTVKPDEFPSKPDQTLSNEALMSPMKSHTPIATKSLKRCANGHTARCLMRACAHKPIVSLVTGVSTWQCASQWHLSKSSC